VHARLQAFSRNLLSKLLSIFAIASALVFITAFAYSKATGTRLGASMFRTYTVLQNTPGADARCDSVSCRSGTISPDAHGGSHDRSGAAAAIREEPLFARCCQLPSPLLVLTGFVPYAGADACNEAHVTAAWVVNLTHLLGLFSYALLLGIISDDVQRTVDAFKHGNTAVYERGHTVVLNVNSTTDHLLRQVRCEMAVSCGPSLLVRVYLVSSPQRGVCRDARRTALVNCVSNHSPTTH
jgi:hypothetical protein